MARALGFDGFCALAAGLTSYLIWSNWITQADVRPPWWIMFLLAPFWIPVMLVARAYETRFLWVGLEEYRRIFHAAVLMLATIATISWAFDLRGARGLVIVALPLTALFTLVQRFGHRQWLYRRRRQGDFLQTTILVGHREAVGAVDEGLQRVPHLGYRVIGCCLPS
ncbi:MAG: nucleoside-diphosphate sugar epimerase/dehydratase, partial [Isosphaeraceae bacterium]